jgi:propionyl-CoA synthetase
LHFTYFGNYEKVEPNKNLWYFFLPGMIFFITIGITVNDEKIFANVKSEVRKFVGPVASFNHVVIMPKLPKTRSGKIARKTGTCKGRLL